MSKITKKVKEIAKLSYSEFDVAIQHYIEYVKKGNSLTEEQVAKVTKMDPTHIDFINIVDRALHIIEHRKAMGTF